MIKLIQNSCQKCRREWTSFGWSKAGCRGGVRKQWYSKGRLLLSSIVSGIQSQNHLHIKLISISGQLNQYFYAIAVLHFHGKYPVLNQIIFQTLEKCQQHFLLPRNFFWGFEKRCNIFNMILFFHVGLIANNSFRCPVPFFDITSLGQASLT